MQFSSAGVMLIIHTPLLLAIKSDRRQILNSDIHMVCVQITVDAFLLVSEDIVVKVENFLFVGEINFDFTLQDDDFGDTLLPCRDRYLAG
jgi:hypothetical protein